MALTPVRFNTLVVDPDHGRQTLTAAGFETHPVAWAPEAAWVAAEPRALTALPAYAAGVFYLQNHASLLPVLVLDPQPGEAVLDLCAAPGGKTTHLAARMGNQGELVANDLSQARVYKLARVLHQYHVTCARTSRLPGHRLWERYPNHFDRVLVDAPCSMHGTATPSASASKSLAKQQRFLLKSALSATRPGGVIVYSTCTTAVEENEAVIAWLLEKHPGQVQVEAVTVPDAPWTPALTADARGRPFPAALALTRRVAQDEALEGFFVARLRKRNTDPEAEPLDD